METDSGDRHSNPLWGAEEIPPRDDPVQDLDQAPVPGSRGLISGLLGLNVVLLGVALITGRLIESGGLQNQEARIFLLLLMGVSALWMLWYLLWARKQPDTSPHQDHHAGGAAVTMVLALFAALSVLLCVCMIGYLMMKRECEPLPRVVSPFMEAPFLALQTYLLWHHSKDCIHRHKIVTRVGLMLILSADVLLWLNAVTEDTVHRDIEREKQASGLEEGLRMSNMNLCECGTNEACLAFRKGVEVLYPFTVELYLMAACMVYIMWKNVGRQVSPGHHRVTQKLTLDLIRQGGVVYGLVSGAVVLLVGLVIFILYQLWVTRQQFRDLAFLLLYVYHLAVTPVMSLCCLVGLLVHRVERHAKEGGYNPTRKLDVVLLIATASGQLALSYFSLVAALALGAQGSLASLDLSYSILTMLELLLQSTFIIEGLHRHPNRLTEKKKKRRRRKFKSDRETPEDGTEGSRLEGDAAVRVHDGKKPRAQGIIKEICAFLILTNVMLWVIPAFGAHPQFENGFGKTFFGFSAWFVVVNVSQPLSAFFRMHSVAALMELLIQLLIE